MVRTMRFELTRESSHYPLKVACLPFHHVRLLLIKYIKLPKNFQANFIKLLKILFKQKI